MTEVEKPVFLHPSESVGLYGFVRVFWMNHVVNSLKYSSPYLNHQVKCFLKSSGQHNFSGNLVHQMVSSANSPRWQPNHFNKVTHSPLCLCLDNQNDSGEHYLQLTRHVRTSQASRSKKKKKKNTIYKPSQMLHTGPSRFKIWLRTQRNF